MGTSGSTVPSATERKLCIDTLCTICYNVTMSKIIRMSDCHPEKRNLAKGQCKDCYYKARYTIYKDKINKRRRLTYSNTLPEKKISRYYKHRANPEYMMWYAAKCRAKLKSLPFDITPDDIKIPQTCPILGIPITQSNNGHFNHNSPSIDRIHSNKGYTKDNILVISFRANSIKKDATVEELRKIYEFYSTFSVR